MLFERYSKHPPRVPVPVPGPFAFPSGDALPAGLLPPAVSTTKTHPLNSTMTTATQPSLKHSLLSKSDQSVSSSAQLHNRDRDDKPLTCIFYFFHSQMSQHLHSQPDPDLVSRGRQSPNQPVHRLDTLLTRLKMNAAFSPLIASFDTYPIAVDDSFSASADVRRQARKATLGKWVRGELGEGGDGGGREAGMTKDTVLLMEFRSKRGREEWMASREWQEFYRGVEGERVCRRMPHVRCAGSLKGLGSVREVLSA